MKEIICMLMCISLLCFVYVDIEYNVELSKLKIEETKLNIEILTAELNHMKG